MNNVAHENILKSFPAENIETVKNLLGFRFEIYFSRRLLGASFLPVFKISHRASATQSRRNMMD